MCNVTRIRAEMRSSTDQAIQKLELINKRFKGVGTVKVGLPADSNDYPDGTSVIMVGAVHEFGSEKMSIPERSFLRSTLVEKRKQLRRAAAVLAKRVAKGEITMSSAQELLGLQLQTYVRQKITDLDSPELTYREGNPLVDTGHLRRSITFVVED